MLTTISSGYCFISIKAASGFSIYATSRLTSLVRIRLKYPGQKVTQLTLYLIAILYNYEILFWPFLIDIGMGILYGQG